jgi:DNA polymerase I
MRQPLLIFDGDNLAHRAYHTTPKTIRGTDGAPINAVAGVFGMIAKMWAEEAPRAIFMAWDTLGVDTYRNALWPAYQGGRVFEPEIVEQLERLPDLCRAFGFGVGKAPGYEADDLMATAARLESETGGSSLIVTTDKDAYQLVDDRVTVLTSRKGVTERIGPKQVVEKLGVLPEQVPDFKALAGDASDGIPGAKGIGPKTAANLLLRHGDLEGVLASWGRVDESDRVRMFRRVVTMDRHAPVELPLSAPDWVSGAAALQALGAENLAKRLLDLA